MSRRAGIVAVLLATACCSKSEVKGSGSAASPDPRPAAKPSFSLFALAEVRGQVGPCGCTSDPLGDLARTSKLVADARAAGPVLVLDAGSLLYSKSPIPPHLELQETAKADLLLATYKDHLQVAAIGLGPADLAKSLAAVRPARQAVNLAAPAAGVVEPPKLIVVNGTKVGVFGVIAQDAIPGLAITDPVAPSKQTIADLKKQGAQVVIALVQAGAKKDAAKLVREIGGIDFAIAGLGLNAPEPDRVEDAQKIGDAWLVVPANRGQVVPRLDITIREAGPFVDAVGPVAAEAKRGAIDKQLAALDADLAKFAADPTADKGFVAQKQTERAELAAQRMRLTSQPLAVPARGNYFTLAQIRINKTLACDVPVQDAITGYNRRSGEANFKVASGVPVPAPPKGAPHYVGSETCADCHQEQVTYWKTTVHAKAWKTLVDRGQQFDYDCIGCHVTGYDKPGGASLGHNETLRDVQCETCHGPGSIHAEKGGTEKPMAIQLKPADDLCATQCHTKEHSDTFDLVPYMRDVLGPGHGAERRKQLGDGPTGRSLRAAALDRAGRTLGAGCLK